MINSEIQELFDHSLSDERMAELLHSLSVSPEKRAEFRRHMKLQDAMRSDRIDNRLTSDEDAAIWGAITGLGVATTSGISSGYSMGWAAKALVFLVMGLGGYLLGSNPSTNLFGGGSEPVASAPVSAPARVASILPNVVTVPFPVIVPQRVKGSPAGSTAPRQHGAASSLIADASSLASSRNARSDRDAASTPSADHLASHGSNDPSMDPNNGGGDRSGAARSATTSSPSTINGDSSGNSTNNNVKSNASEPSHTDTAAKSNGTSAAAQKVPLSPEQTANALHTTQSETPSNAGDVALRALSTDGFEVAYGERVGTLTKNPSAVDNDPTFSNRYFDLSYRFNDGMFGFGARLGYGSFSLVSLQPTLKTKRDRNGYINLIDTIYRSTMSAEEKPLVEFFFNYRLPLGTHFAISLEALAGGSTNHNKIGGDLSLLWLLTDRIGIQAGGGFSRYWYSISASDRDDLLKAGGDGTSIDDNFVDLTEGGMFEGRYGLFFHF